VQCVAVFFLFAVCLNAARTSKVELQQSSAVKEQCVVVCCGVFNGGAQRTSKVELQQCVAVCGNVSKCGTCARQR